MKKLLIIFFAFAFSATSHAQSPITFEILNPACDSDGIVVAHFAPPALTRRVIWSAPTAGHPLGIIDTITSLTDTIWGYTGGHFFVYGYDLSSSAMGPHDTGSHPGSPLPFTLSHTNTPVSDSTFSVHVTVTGGVPPYSYRWYNYGKCPCGWGDAGTVLGTSNPINLTVYPVSLGSIYDVEVTDAAGCWVSSCMHGEFRDTLKISTSIPMQKESDPGLVLYPNPAGASLTLSLPGEVICQVSITDMVGRLRHDNKYNSKQVAVDVADLPNGIYFIKVNERYTRRFMKQ